MLLLLPLCSSLLLALAGSEAGPRAGRLAASGGLGALACWTKQTAFPPVLFVLGLSALRLWRAAAPGSPRRSAVVRGVGAWSVGSVAASAAILAYFAANDGLEELLYWSFVHGMLYGSESSLSDTLPRVGSQLWDLARGSPTLLIVALLSSPLLLRGGFEAAVGVFLLCALVTLPLGHVYPHYLALLAPPLALLCGAGLSRATQAIRRRSARRWLAAALGVALVGGQLVASSRYYLSASPEEIARDAFGGNPFVLSEEIARFLRADGDPDDRVLIFGSEPQILLLSGRRSASSFVVIYPLMRQLYPRYREFQERMIEEVRADPPEYIILVKLPASLLWDGVATLEAAGYVRRLASSRYDLVRTYVRPARQLRWVALETALTPEDAADPALYVIGVFRRREAARP